MLLSPLVCYLLLEVCGAKSYYYPEEKDMAGWGTACATNKDQQSPIDLPTRQDLNRLPMYSNYSETARWTFTGPGSGLTFVPTDTSNPGSLDISALGYTGPAKMHSFHWHVGSENRINGKQFAACVHFVHTTPETPSGLLVLGVLFDISPEDGEEMEDYLDFVEGNIAGADVEFDVNMLTKNLDLGKYYDWMGSLTTPGCNLGVKWTLTGTILDISIEQMARLVKAIGAHGNFRNPQPLGDRIIGPPPKKGDTDYEDDSSDAMYLEDKDMQTVMFALVVTVVVMMCVLCVVVMRMACCADVMTNKMSLLPGAQKAAMNKHYMTNTTRGNTEMSLSQGKANVVE